MREGNLYALALDVYDGIERLIGHLVGEEVFQAVAADDALPIVVDGEPGVEIRVVAEHILHELRVEAIADEEGGVGLEGDERAVVFLRRPLLIADERAALEDGAVELSVAV